MTNVRMLYVLALSCSILLNVFFVTTHIPASELIEKFQSVNSAFCHTPTCPVLTSPKLSETMNSKDCSNKTIAWNTVGQVGNQFGCHLRQLLEWIDSLKTKEKHMYSQHGEDGVTEAIFERIGHGTKFFVEFGVQDGIVCNTRFLREKFNWTGLLMDNNNFNPALNLQKETIWIDNVIDLFRKHSVPLKFDYLSVDTDFADFWLIKVVLESGYRPRVIISETNKNHPPYASLTVSSTAAKAHGMFKGTRFYGTSGLALTKMVHIFGYQAVYVEKSSTNIFFIHKSELYNTDLALAHWVKVVSESSQMGQGDHGVQDSKDSHSHICVDSPCRSSNDW